MTEEYERMKIRVADEITSVWQADKSILEMAASILALDGIEIRAENQDPPECKHLARETFYLNRVCPMLTPKDGYVWKRVIVKEE